MRTLALIVALLAGACQTSAGANTPPAPIPEGADEPHPHEGDGSAEATGEATDDGSGEEERPSTRVEQPEFVTLWVGLYCNATDADLRNFSFYVDGEQIQALETPCVGSATPPEEVPNGGQFRAHVRPGVSTLRIQDDTHDYFSEWELAIPGDHWVFIDHKVLAGNAGHMTSMLNWFVPPPFAF